MIAKVRIDVDCLGRPATVEISSVIRTGEHELDLVLFHAMSIAVRNFADEVNADQARVLEADGAPLDEAALKVIQDRREQEEARRAAAVPT